MAGPLGGLSQTLLRAQQPPGLPKPGRLPKPPGFAQQRSQALAGASQAAAQNRQLSQGVSTKPPVPPQPSTSGVSQGGGGAADSPLDATYYNDIANYLFKTNNSIAADQAKIAQNNTALQSALGQLNYQEPRSDLALNQGMNARGGLYSSVQQQGLADLGTKFATARTANTTHYGNLNQGLQSEIGNLQATEDPNSPTMLAFALASAQRAAAAAQANQALGAPAPALAPAPSPAPVAAAPSTANPHPATMPQQNQTDRARAQQAQAEARNRQNKKGKR